MRTKKITEIRDLLRSDPRKQPYLIYYSETYSDKSGTRVPLSILLFDLLQ